MTPYFFHIFSQPVIPPRYLVIFPAAPEAAPPSQPGPRLCLCLCLPLAQPCYRGRGRAVVRLLIHRSTPPPPLDLRRETPISPVRLPLDLPCASLPTGDLSFQAGKRRCLCTTLVRSLPHQPPSSTTVCPGCYGRLFFSHTTTTAGSNLSPTRVFFVSLLLFLPPTSSQIHGRPGRAAVDSPPAAPTMAPRPAVRSRAAAASRVRGEGPRGSSHPFPAVRALAFGSHADSYL